MLLNLIWSLMVRYGYNILNNLMSIFLDYSKYFAY